MPTFVLLLNWTDPEAGTLDALAERTAVAKDAIADFEGRWHSELYTQGAFEVVATVEAPSEERLAAFALSLQAGGDLRVTTLRAFDTATVQGIVDDAAAHGGKLHAGKLHAGKLHAGKLHAG